MNEDWKFWLPIIVSVIIAIITLFIMHKQNKKNNKTIKDLNNENQKLTNELDDKSNFIKRVEDYIEKFKELEQKYNKYSSDIDNIKNKINNLETYKTKFLLSKIFNIDITFQSIDDKLLLNNIIEEIKEPETEIDYLLLGLALLGKYKEEHFERDAEKAEENLYIAISKAIGNNIDGKFISECHNYLGVLYDKKEIYNKAIDQYEQSRKKNPKNPKPYYNLACTYSKLLENSPDEKEKVEILKKIETNIKKALELKPEDYITALKDDDFPNIQKEAFFIEIIDEAARKYHKCNSYKITKDN